MNNPPAPISLPDATTIQLHPDAEQLADTFAASHRNEIIRLAKTLAVQDSANQVQSGHIEAARLLFRRKPSRSIFTDFALAIGGAFFGAFVQGFTEALIDGKTNLIAIYVVLGFLGLTIIFGAALKR